MGSCKIIVTAKADGDLLSIHNYLSENASENVAESVVDAIMDGISSLVTFPKAHPLLSKAISRKGYRYFEEKSYVVIYKVEESKSQIDIVRILHAHRELKSIL